MSFAQPVSSSLHLFGMDIAINLQDEQLFRTEEVDNVRTNGMLPTKFD